MHAMTQHNIALTQHYHISEPIYRHYVICLLQMDDSVEVYSDVCSYTQDLLGLGLCMR